MIGCVILPVSLAAFRLELPVACLQKFSQLIDVELMPQQTPKPIGDQVIGIPGWPLLIALAAEFLLLITVVCTLSRIQHDGYFLLHEIGHSRESQL